MLCSLGDCAHRLYILHWRCDRDDVAVRTTEVAGAQGPRRSVAYGVLTHPRGQTNIEISHCGNAEIIKSL